MDSRWDPPVFVPAHSLLHIQDQYELHNLGKASRPSPMLNGNDCGYQCHMFVSRPTYMEKASIRNNTTSKASSASRRSIDRRYRTVGRTRLGNLIRNGFW